MTSNEAVDVKTIIKSLLISNPLRTNIRQLWKDYEEMVGQPVPLQLLGFKNFEQYLNTIPDTVRVYGSGPHAEVEGVVSSKSQHINDMVLKQKKNSKKRIHPRRQPPRCQPKRNFETKFPPVQEPTPFKTSGPALLPTPRAAYIPNHVQTFQESSYTLPKQEVSKPKLKFKAESPFKTRAENTSSNANNPANFPKSSSPLHETISTSKPNSQFDAKFQSETKRIPSLMSSQKTSPTINNSQTFPQNFHSLPEKPSPITLPHFQFDIKSQFKGKCSPSLSSHSSSSTLNNSQIFPHSFHSLPEASVPISKPHFHFDVKPQFEPKSNPSLSLQNTPSIIKNIPTFPESFYSLEEQAIPISQPPFKFDVESQFEAKCSPSLSSQNTSSILKNTQTIPESFCSLQHEPIPISKPLFQSNPEFQFERKSWACLATENSKFSSRKEEYPVSPKGENDTRQRLHIDGCDESPPAMKLNFLSALPKYGNLDILEDETPSFMKLNQVPTLQHHGKSDIPGIKEFSPVGKACSETLTTDIEYDYSSPVPEKVQRNLKQLIQNFPDGLECSKLPAQYEKMFKKKISYLNYNYRSVIEMCSDLPRIFHYVQQSLDDYTLFDKDKPIPASVMENLPNKGVEDETVVPSHSDELAKINYLTSMSFLPPSVFKRSEQIDRFFLGEVEVGDILDITIGEIYDLSKFWIYITFSGLHELMKDMQSFFAANHSTYHIPEALLEEGLCCASLFAGNYHRCVIVNLLESQRNFVRVLYIDYGTVQNVSKNEIWYLPKQFGELPWQILRTRLANIYPVHENYPWSGAAVARFEQLIVNRVVVAKVTKIDTKDHVLEVYLADITNEDDFFYINDIFVKEGFAKFADQERKTPPIDPDCVPLVKYIHLYPDFYEIEGGLAPTTDEMYYIYEYNIPLHIYMPQYFDIYYKEDIASIQLKYVECNRESSEVNFPATIEDPEVDFSFFPDWLIEDIEAIYRSNPSNKTRATAPPAQETREIPYGELNESVKEYSCNRKRILEFITSDNSNVDMCESNDFCVSPLSHMSVSPEQSPDVDSVVSGLEQINLNNNLLSASRASTNPFLSDIDTSVNTFSPTNPFWCELSSIEKSSSDMLNSLAKSSGDNLPQRINNNLKESHSCTCKQSKQTNVEKTLVNGPLSTAEEANSSSVAGTSGEISTPAVERIRTPPGFSSTNCGNGMPFAANVANFFNYGPSVNPYYQRFPMMFNNNTFMSPNMSFPFVQPNNFFNNVPERITNPYNFNTNPNMQQMFRPPYP